MGGGSGSVRERERERVLASTITGGVGVGGVGCDSEGGQTYSLSPQFLDRVTLCLTPRLKAELRQARPPLADKQRILSLVGPPLPLSLPAPAVRGKGTNESPGRGG